MRLLHIDVYSGQFHGEVEGDGKIVDGMFMRTNRGFLNVGELFLPEQREQAEAIGQLIRQEKTRHNEEIHKLTSQATALTRVWRFGGES